LDEFSAKVTEMWTKYVLLRYFDYVGLIILSWIKMYNFAGSVFPR